MQVDDIRRLVKLVEESDIDELEVRRWFTVVRILKRNGVSGGEKTVVVTAPSIPAPMPAPAPVVVAPKETNAAPPEAKSAAPAPTAPAADDALIAIRSPMVGTFYRSSAPDRPAYVEIGQPVSSGQVVCIVEAMKLMNEIESEVSGTVAKVLVENAQPVEFNQPLFLVRPS